MTKIRTFTVAILAQGTSWADAATQAFFIDRFNSCGRRRRFLWQLLSNLSRTSVCKGFRNRKSLSVPRTPKSRFFKPRKNDVSTFAERSAFCQYGSLCKTTSETGLTEVAGETWLGRAANAGVENKIAWSIGRFGSNTRSKSWEMCHFESLVSAAK